MGARTLDKRQVLRLLRQRLAAQLETLTASQQAAQSGATHDETRQEHPKDTRAIEAQYLARGLADRVETLRAGVTTLAALRLSSFGDDEIGLSALIGVRDEAGQPAVYFLVPVGGGETVHVDGHAVQALTPVSPIGRALLEKQVGDEAAVDLPSGRVRLVVEWVA